MPPRRIAKSTAAKQKGATSSTPRSPAREVYDIPEIRSAILRQLSKHDLATFMRVQKKGMAVVTSELYYSMPFEYVKDFRKACTPQQRMYLAAITEVDARDLALSPHMMKGHNYSKSHGSTGPERIKNYLRIFRAPILELLIPLLRKRCINVCTVIFGHPSFMNFDDFWVVRLDPDCDAQIIGQVDLIRTIEFDVADEPPLAIPPPDVSPRFSINQKFNVCVCHTDRQAFTATATRKVAQQWIHSLVHTEVFADIAGGIDLEAVPVSLNDLSAMCKRYIDKHGQCRLSRVSAPLLISFNLADFRKFAGSARYLTSLDLTHGTTGRDYVAGKRAISLADLRDVLSTIRRDLPVLRQLQVELRGIDAAEGYCRDLLFRNLLATRGSIRHLRIFTSAHSLQLFNLLRFLSQVCDTSSERFCIWIGDDWHRDMSLTFMAHQIDFVRYLHKQSVARGKYLSTVDFGPLGIKNLSDVTGLTYSPDDRPCDIVMNWSHAAQNAVALINTTQLPKLDAGLKHVTKATLKLAKITATSGPVERLKEARKLLDSVVLVKSVAAAIEEAMGTEKQERDLRVYIQGLEKAVKEVRDKEDQGAEESGVNELEELEEEEDEDENESSDDGDISRTL